MKPPKVNTKRERVQFMRVIDWPEGTLPEIRKYLNMLEQSYPDYELSIMPHWIGYEDCQYELHGWRLETDDEQKERIKKEELLLQEWYEKEKTNAEKRRQKIKKAIEAKKEAIKKLEQQIVELKSEGETS